MVYLRIQIICKGDVYMPELEVFFDYACPYCLKGHTYTVKTKVYNDINPMRNEA